MRKITVICSIALAIVMVGFATDVVTIPKTWNMEEIRRFHLSPPDPSVEVKYVPEEYYYSFPEHEIVKTYPVYVREFEPKGYIDSLRKLERKVVFDVSKIRTQEDWIKAGELVFNWPASFSPFKGNTTKLTAEDFKDDVARLSKQGTLESNRYVITGKGTIMVGSLSCASCHTRILDSGEIVPGAQGNVATIKGLMNAVRVGAIPLPVIREGMEQLTYVPWAPDANLVPDNVDEVVSYFESAKAGVIDRQGAAFNYPLSVPSLIGIKDVKYLDHTGIMKHDGPGDMMRYAAFNQGMDMLTSYDGYIPSGVNKNSTLPEVGKFNHPFSYAAKRYSDAQLYALTQYLYSLQPPKNPNKYPKSLVAKGKGIFTRSGCVSCHTPPLYTNNKLTPVNGFEPPKDHFRKYDIFDVSVGTDSVSALYSRRATGYYKVPSLRGAWYRNAFFHNGNLTSLEEVLDPKRLEESYVPAGFIPFNRKAMAVKGHPFGMDLSEADKKALIAFIKTL